MRAEVQQAKREPKPMVRIFQGGSLVTEYDCEGMKEDITIHITNAGDDRGESLSAPQRIVYDDGTMREASLRPADAKPQEPREDPEPIEERVPVPEPRRRSTVRPSIQRRRGWWHHRL